MEAGSWSSIKADMEVAIGDTSTNYTKKGNSKRSMTGLSGKKNYDVLYNNGFIYKDTTIQNIYKQINKE